MLLKEMLAMLMHTMAVHIAVVECRPEEVGAAYLNRLKAQVTMVLLSRCRHLCLSLVHG
jgi:hypothetical protein